MSENQIDCVDLDAELTTDAVANPMNTDLEARLHVCLLGVG